MSLRLSTVILPYVRWHEGGRSMWQRAEQLGFAKEDVVWVVAPFNTAIQPGDKTFDI